ncbi:MAG: phytanoyl-CoA dioxygenase family protein, partial [Kiloniellales bacterium]
MNGFVESAVGELRENGYVLVPDVIAPAECERLKAILEEAHRAYAPHYVGNVAAAHRLNFHQDEKIVYNIHNKDRAFLKLIDLPPVFDIVEALLQEGSYRKADPVIMRQNTARTHLKGKPFQQLHID